MKQEYYFFDCGTIEFDDEKSVKELLAQAFDMFGYYEPMGMEIVTLFQAYHPDTNTGWFTTDTTLSCAEEIKNPKELYFAYHLPNIFYFAEGGWGSSMTKLGNHPKIDNAVSLIIQFDDFKNTVVINGEYTFSDVIKKLKQTEYIDDNCKYIEVIPVGCTGKSYAIPFRDPIMNVCLSDFEKILEQYNSERIHPDAGDFIYHTVLRIC